MFQIVAKTFSVLPFSLRPTRKIDLFNKKRGFYSLNVFWLMLRSIREKYGYQTKIGNMADIFCNKISDLLLLVLYQYAF